MLTETNDRRWFLSDLGEPTLYRDRADQLLKTMGDCRCAGAPTCPFHRIPGEQWDAATEVIKRDPFNPFPPREE